MWSASTFAIRYSATNPTFTPSSEIPLTAGEWADGALTAGGQKIWYSFTASADTTYYVQWNDGYDGDSTKTALIKVTAYDESGANIGGYSQLFGYNDPKTITGVSGIVYLKVQPYDSDCTGTFAIRYSATDPTFTPADEITLTDGTWTEGELDSGDVLWYTFTASESATYSVQWDDYYDGSDSYSGDIRVSAYDASGANIWGYPGDDGYEELFTIEGVSGTVYLKVQGYNTGTFAIKYSTDD